MAGDAGTDTMRAAVFKAPGEVVYERVPQPTLSPDRPEVLVRTELATICGSDVHAIHHGVGMTPAAVSPGYPGHEGVGEVVDSTTERFRPGERVLTLPVPDLAAGFADYQVLGPEQLLRIDDGEIPASTIVLAQQLGTVIHGIERFWPPGGADVAAVVGAGSAGLLFIGELLRRGTREIVVSDLDETRLDWARRLGATQTVHAPHESIAEAVRARSGGRGADIVIEAAGYDDARDAAVDCLAVGGTLGMFGLAERVGLSPFPVNTLFRRKATVRAIYGAQSEPGLPSFRAAIARLTEEDALPDVGKMLTHTYPIERIADALAHASQPSGACKIAVSFSDA